MMRGGFLAALNGIPTNALWLQLFPIEQSRGTFTHHSKVYFAWYDHNLGRMGSVYRRNSELPEGYTHQVVNHSENFVDPETLRLLRGH
jgi:hypothetical protein